VSSSSELYQLFTNHMRISRRFVSCWRAFSSIFLLITLALTLGATSAPGDEACPDSTRPEPTDQRATTEVADATRVYFESDLAEIIDLGKRLKGSGNVRISTDNTTFMADEVVYDTEENTFRAIGHEPGNVVMKREGSPVTADEVTYNIESETGELVNAEGEFPPWFFKTRLLKRTGPNSAELEGGHLTTCDLAHPHYRLTADSIEITDDEKLVARDARVYLGPVPILRIPRFSYQLGEAEFPFDFSAGHEDRLGYFLRTEYRLDIAEKFSGDLHADVYTDEGFGTGVDGDAGLIPGGETSFNTYMTTKEKGRAEIYHTQEIPDNWRAIVQMEQWTDEDFLEQFEYDEFRRRTEPETFVNLTRTKPYHIISLTARKRTNGWVEEVERLPELNVTFLERQLGTTPFYYGIENSTGYLVDRPGEEHTLRSFTGARLSYPVHPTRWFSVTPFAGVDGTYYSDGLEEDDLYRTSLLGGVTVGTRVHRVYGSPFESLAALKHVVVPTLTYAYRPKPDVTSTEIHEFDALDDVVGRQRIGFELDNLLLSKTSQGNQRQLARLTLYSGTDITNEHEEHLDWAAQAHVSPSDRLGFRLDAEVHHADEDFERFHGRFYYKEKETGGYEVRLGMGYSETETGILNEEVSYYLATNLGEKWRVSLEHRYDFHDNDLEFQEYKIWRDLHCFEGAISYRIRERSQRVFISIGLKAFPSSQIKF